MKYEIMATTFKVPFALMDHIYYYDRMMNVTGEIGHQRLRISLGLIRIDFQIGWHVCTFGG